MYVLSRYYAVLGCKVVHLTFRLLEREALDLAFVCAGVDCLPLPAGEERAVEGLKKVCIVSIGARTLAIAGWRCVNGGG